MVLETPDTHQEHTVSCADYKVFLRDSYHDADNYHAQQSGFHNGIDSDEPNKSVCRGELLMSASLLTVTQGESRYRWTLPHGSLSCRIGIATEKLCFDSGLSRQLFNGYHELPQGGSPSRRENLIYNYSCMS